MPGSDRPRRPRQGREGAVALDGRSDRAQKEHLHVARAQLREDFLFSAGLLHTRDKTSEMTERHRKANLLLRGESKPT